MLYKGSGASGCADLMNRLLLCEGVNEIQNWDEMNGMLQ